MDNEAVAEVIERRAEERGEVVREAAETVVDYVAFLRGVVETVGDLMDSGDVLPGIRDALSAARLLSEFDTGDESAQELEHMKRLFAVHIEATREVMSRDQLREWSARIGNHPFIVQLLDQPSDASRRSDS